MAMSDQHQDLESIHNILLGQRKVAQDALTRLVKSGSHNQYTYDLLNRKVDVIDDLLLEFEEAGVVWPTNVVELNTVTTPCACKHAMACGRDCQSRPTNHPEDGA